MIILRNKNFSKKSPDDRDIVPKSIAEKAKTEGVVQEYKGDWRIVSFKTDPPSFWNSHYTSKEKAMQALKAYQANKH